MLVFLRNAIRFGAVFIFGSTGEIIIEKSGHLNLGIPGIMCFGAVGGCVGEAIYMSSLPDLGLINPFVAIIIGILFSMLFAGAMGLLYGIMTISLRCNQNVTGLTITTFGIGILNFFIKKMGTEGTTFYLVSDCFTKSVIQSDSVGWFYQLFLSYGPLVYLAFIIAIVAAIILKKTRTGLNLNAIGENPAAADAAGINVSKYKYVSSVLGASISGLGGLYCLMDITMGSLEYPIDAMGWLAVALVIFSLWKPAVAILGSILFGGLYILPSYLNVNFSQMELVNMLPYAVTIVILIATSIRNKKENQPPASLGLSYFREER